MQCFSAGLRQSYSPSYKCLMLQANLSCKREREGKAGAFAVCADDPDAPTEPLDDALANVQPQAGTLRSSRGGISRLPELFEDGPLLAGRNSRSVVAHVHAHAAVRLRERDFDPPSA